MSDTHRLDDVCINAIDDIRKRISKHLRIKIPFSEGSRLLGEKYYRGHLEAIPFVEIRSRYAHLKGHRKTRRNL